MYNDVNSIVNKCISVNKCLSKSHKSLLLSLPRPSLSHSPSSSFFFPSFPTYLLTSFPTSFLPSFLPFFLPSFLPPPSCCYSLMSEKCCFQFNQFACLPPFFQSVFFLFCPKNYISQPGTWNCCHM
jgi:hypothetical protein